MIKVKEEKLVGSICKDNMLLLPKLGKEIIKKGKQTNTTEQFVYGHTYKNPT